MLGGPTCLDPCMAGAPVELLRRVPFFADLERRELEGVARSMKERTFSAGDTIATEGQGGVGFFVIEEGSATVEVRGQERGRLGAGDHFGEIALLRNVPRTATVTALTPLRLIAIEREPFLEAVTGHPQSQFHAEAIASERMAGPREA